MPNQSTPIAPGAQPFFLPGNQTGVVIVHGYGGSIGDYRAFAEGLHKFGYSVSGLRLAGHGQRLEDLRHSHLVDWRDSIDRAVADLRSHCQQVVLIGASFGGTLVLDYLQRQPGTVAGVILVNPAITYRHGTFQRILLKFLRVFTPYYPKLGLTSKDKAKYHQLGSSTAWPIDGLFETYALIHDQIIPQLNLVTNAVLLLGNSQDPIVSFQSIQFLHQHLNHSKIVTIPGRTHRPFRDPATTAFLVQAAQTFIESLALNR